MSSPPKEEGRTRNTAPLETANTAILAQQLKQINTAAPKVWADEGWRLLAQYQKTGDSRHREACDRHVAGIRMRLREAGGQ
jgi:hypothetical protein